MPADSPRVASYRFTLTGEGLGEVAAELQPLNPAPTTELCKDYCGNRLNRFPEVCSLRAYGCGGCNACREHNEHTSASFVETFDVFMKDDCSKGCNTTISQLSPPDAAWSAVVVATNGGGESEPTFYRFLCPSPSDTASCRCPHRWCGGTPLSGGLASSVTQA